MYIELLMTLSNARQLWATENDIRCILILLSLSFLQGKAKALAAQRFNERVSTSVSKLSFLLYYKFNIILWKFSLLGNKHYIAMQSVDNSVSQLIGEYCYRPYWAHALIKNMCL